MNAKRFDALLRVLEAQGGWFHESHLDYETAYCPEAAKDGVTLYQDLSQEQQGHIQEIIG
jgi:hypothetical protein